MRALDTNILVYAAIANSEHHVRALEVLTDCAEGEHPWALPWPCIYEFLRIVTHPRVFDPPATAEHATAEIEAILESPSLILLSETDRHARFLSSTIRDAGAKGNLMHDAHIAALCLEHGVRELWTGDRDFARFTDLRVVDPFR